MKKIKELLRKNITLISNFGYLSVLQVFNIVLPLITYPYLIRVLGKELYGMVIFAQTIAMIFSIVIEFGFSITATKHVAVYRESKKKLTEIVSSVLIIKTFLAIISFIVLLGLVWAIPNFQDHKLLYILAMLLCLNEVLFCQWFFQGIEKMKYITIISVITRLLFVLLILIFVKNKSHYLLVPLFGGLGALFNGLISLYIIHKTMSLKLYFPSLKILKFYLLDAAPIFWSRIISKIKDQSNTLLIGATVGMVEVAYYDLIQKIVNIINSFIETITVALFPKLSHTLNTNITRKFFSIILGIIFIAYLALLYFGEYIVLLLGGENMLNSVILIPLMGLMLLRASSYYIGNAILIVNNKKKAYLSSLYVSSFSYFIIIGGLFLFHIEIDILVFVWATVISMLAGYFYRIYACYKHKLINNIIKI